MDTVKPLVAARGSTSPGQSRSVVAAHLRDVWQFVQKPDRRPRCGGWMSRWLTVMVLDFALVLVCEVLAMGLPESVQDTAHLMDQMPIGVLSLLVVFFAPVAEELIFRAGLRNATYLMFVGPGVLAAFGGTMSLVAAWAVVAAACLTVWRRPLALPGGRVRRARQFSQRYVVWFWVYTLAFGLVHISNYQPEAGQWLWLPLLVVPQTITGVLLGYLRIRGGLFSAMLAHFVHNLVAVVLLAWLK